MRMTAIVLMLMLLLAATSSCIVVNKEVGAIPHHKAVKGEAEGHAPCKPSISIEEGEVCKAHLTKACPGVVLISPDGKKWLLTVDNMGNLQAKPKTEQKTEPTE